MNLGAGESITFPQGYLSNELTINNSAPVGNAEIALLYSSNTHRISGTVNSGSGHGPAVWGNALDSTKTIDIPVNYYIDENGDKVQASLLSVQTTCTAYCWGTGGGWPCSGNGSASYEIISDNGKTVQTGSCSISGDYNPGQTRSASYTANFIELPNCEDTTVFTIKARITASGTGNSQTEGSGSGSVTYTANYLIPSE